MLAACRRVAWCGEGESINVLFPSLEIPLSDAIFEMSPMMAKIFSFQNKYFLSKNKVFKPQGEYIKLDPWSFKTANCYIY